MSAASSPRRWPDASRRTDAAKADPLPRHRRWHRHQRRCGSPQARPAALASAVVRTPLQRRPPALPAASAAGWSSRGGIKTRQHHTEIGPGIDYYNPLPFFVVADRESRNSISDEINLKNIALANRPNDYIIHGVAVGGWRSAPLVTPPVYRKAMNSSPQKKYRSGSSF